jgi:uncharacterized protein YpmS
MEAGDVVALLIVVALPVLAVVILASKFFRFREKKLEVEAMNAAEKAAQYASRSTELEQRVRVLEQIVTDGGIQTASQLEALRDHARIPARDEAR